MGVLGRTLSKSLGIIPLVGDALILAELMGLNVFDKIGNWIDEKTTDTKELRDELEQANKALMAKNQFYQGTTTETLNEIQGTPNEKGKKTGGLRQQFADGLKSEGFLSEKEFIALQTKFNTLAENANIDLRIEMNDVSHIQKALDELEQQAKRLNEDELQKLSKQFTGLTEDTVTRTSSTEKEEKNVDEAYKNVQIYTEKVKELNRIKEESPSLWSSENDNMLAQASLKLDYWNSQLDKSNEKILENN